MKNIVYRINFPNNKNYIGITSNNLHKRKLEHLSRARNGYTNAVYNALRKYKEVEWEILESCISYDEAKQKEKEYIKKYNSYADGYNMTLGGDGTLGIKFSDEHRQKLSKSHTGYKMPKSQKEAISKAKSNKILTNAKPCYGIHTVTGEVIRFNSIVEAARLGGFDRINIYRCCTDQRKTHKKYEWKYEE